METFKSPEDLLNGFKTKFVDEDDLPLYSKKDVIKFMNDFANQTPRQLKEENDNLKTELASMIGAIEHLSIGASAEKVDLYFQMPNDEKPTIIHPDKVKGIYEGVRQEMINMMGFGRKAVESHYKLQSVEYDFGQLKEELDVANIEIEELKKEVERLKEAVQLIKEKDAWLDKLVEENEILKQSNSYYKSIIAETNIQHATEIEKLEDTLQTYEDGAKLVQFELEEQQAEITRLKGLLPKSDDYLYENYIDEKKCGHCGSTACDGEECTH